MIRHGLSSKQLDIIRDILRPFLEHIDSVGLFGSRATGLYRANSDIDIVIYGSLDEKSIDRLFTLLNESQLPMTVDVQAYNLIKYQPLKDHIDANMLVLFNRESLDSY